MYDASFGSTAAAGFAAGRAGGACADVTSPPLPFLERLQNEFQSGVAPPDVVGALHGELQPLAEMGSAAAQMLGELIDGVPQRTTRVELSTELQIRESTGAPQKETV